MNALRQALPGLIGAVIAGCVSSVATITAIRVELVEIRRDVDRHESYFQLSYRGSSDVENANGGGATAAARSGASAARSARSAAGEG